MKILISIDDTDDIGTKGTGEILEELCCGLKKKFGGNYSRVTRHQLLVHDDIPYTSHNSSMCCEAEIDGTHLDGLKDFSIRFLESNCADRSDPGLCIAVTENLKPGVLDKLIKWGYSAKIEVLTKDGAYKLAGETGIHLSEHGGTGDGVIGALAGAGLRLTGNDGRFKGKFDMHSPEGYLSVKEIEDSEHIDEIRDEKFNKIPSAEKIYIADKIKTVLYGHKSVLLVKKDECGRLTNLSRKEIKEI
ncbi:MAG: hypothetical protein JXN63_05190 [Candidatus Delongbacteria bacterium]|nr:hypothetical protein [Candidatus Delongbacteria bacterium]